MEPFTSEKCNRSTTVAFLLPASRRPALAKDRDDYFAPYNDWAFYSAQHYLQDIVSSMIVMDDCTPENGPLSCGPLPIASTWSMCTANVAV